MARTKQTKRRYPTFESSLASKPQSILEMMDLIPFNPPTFPEWTSTGLEINLVIPDELLSVIFLYSLNLVKPSLRKHWIETFALVSKSFWKALKFEKTRKKARSLIAMDQFLCENMFSASTFRDLDLPCYWNFDGSWFGMMGNPKEYLSVNIETVLDIFTAWMAEMRPILNTNISSLIDTYPCLNYIFFIKKGLIQLHDEEVIEENCFEIPESVDENDFWQCFIYGTVFSTEGLVDEALDNCKTKLTQILNQIETIFKKYFNKFYQVRHDRSATIYYFFVGELDSCFLGFWFCASP